MGSLLVHNVLPLAFVLTMAFAIVSRYAPNAANALAQNFRTRFWSEIALCVVAVYALALALAVMFPACIDVVEATVADTAALYHRGQPLYTALDAPARYSLLYGPLCTLPYSAALTLFGPTLNALKAALALFNVALFAALWFAFRRILPHRESLIALGFIASALMMKGMSTFLIRGDVAMLLAVALALLAATLRSRPAAVALFALAAAYAVDIKFTAAFYLLVPFAALWQSRGRLTALLAAAIAAPLALLPFALPGVSLANYLAWLHAASKHPLAAKLFAGNLISAAFLLALPAFAFASLYLRDRTRAEQWLAANRLLLAALLLSVAGSAITGSKLGAGRPHLNASFVLAAWVAALLWREARATPPPATNFLTFAAAIYSLVFILPAILQLRDMFEICAFRHGYARNVNADLAAIRAAHPSDTIELAYNLAPGTDPADPLANFEPQLALAGNPVLLDAGALFDQDLSRLPIPPATLQALNTCAIHLWLVPHGTIPFTLHNTYAFDAPSRFPDPRLFSDTFRTAFHAHYTLAASSQFFDLYSCTR